jgi:hypothetical protein
MFLGYARDEPTRTTFEKSLSRTMHVDESRWTFGCWRERSNERDPPQFRAKNSDVVVTRRPQHCESSKNKNHSRHPKSFSRSFNPAV